MKPEITAEVLGKLLKSKGMKQKEICPILDLSESNVSNILKLHRKISAAEQKILRLYFYDELPFELGKVDRGEELANVLKFTPQEWQAICILSKREGFMEPKFWIRGKILAHLEQSPAGQEAMEEAGGGEPSSKVAEDADSYGKRTIDPSEDEKLNDNGNGGAASA